jgi:predicted RND superfamily exporter protein
MPLRRRIEAGFTGWGHFIVRRRWAALGVCVLLTAALSYPLPRMRVDNSEEGFLKERDAERLRYDRFKQQFDSDARIQLVLHPPEIFDLDFLEKLRALHLEVEREVPYLEEITSLVNARDTRGEGNRLIVEDLLEHWPRDARELERVRTRALANPLYTNILISENGEYTVVTLKPFTYSTRGPGGDELEGFDDVPDGAASEPEYLTEEEGFELVEALTDVVARHAGPDFEIHVLGGQTFEYRMFQMLQRDVSTLMGLSFLVIAGLLYLLFRRASGVLLPLLVVLSAVASSLGLMVWIDIPFSVTLNMLPAFLMVVGVCDSIHILAIVYRQLAAGSTREEAIAFALGHSGLAVVMTSVTTACGLLSFSVAELLPIVQLGILAPAGVILAMVYSIVLLPALLAIVPLRRAPSREGIASRGVLDRFLAGLGDLSTRHPRRIVAGAGILILISLPGLLQVRFSHDGMRWFPDRDPLKIAVQLVNREFKGSSTLEVLVRTRGENGLHDPDVLRRIERAMRFSETLEVDGQPVNKAVSLVDVVKETHQALNENRPDFYVLPEQRQLIAQELLLFENSGSDDLDDVTDSRFQTARVTVRTPWVDALAYLPYVDEIGRGFRQILGEELEFELTGGPVLFSRVFEAVIHSMARSYVFALVVITPIMILLIGNLRRGMVAMIPNLVPIYLVLALMGFADIPLDASTLLIGGVIIGLAVDDTIHFMHKFGRYYEDSGDPVFAVHETLATTGSALLFTSLVLSMGFAVFLGAYMLNTAWFGLLACVGTVTAFVADVLLGPALMVLVTRREMESRTR